LGRDTVPRSVQVVCQSIQFGHDDEDGPGRKLKDGITSLRGLANPADAVLVVLTAVSEVFERAVTLVVRASELVGERPSGSAPTKADGRPRGRPEGPLSTPSVFGTSLKKAGLLRRERR